MRVKVIKRFVDKNTRDMREIGATCEYETERAKELIDKGFVEKVSAKEDTDKAEKVAEIEQEAPKTAKKKTTK